MKIGSVVTTLLLTTITVLSTARPGRGTGKAGSVPHTTQGQSASSTSGITTRVSVASDGSQGYGHSDDPSISADGRIVAFTSNADNLISNDSNGSSDVFVHDRDTGETIRVSVAFDGSQGIGPSYAGSISADGRVVLFDSSAANLVSDDNTGYRDVFVYDRDTEETSLVSVSSGGAQGNADSLAISISSDGRFVLFDSWADNLVGGDSNGHRDVFVHDRDTGETTRVSVATGGLQGNNETYGAAISADGRFVVFDSLADNLVDDDRNGRQDVFLHDRDSGTTIRVSVASGGIEAGHFSRSPAISASGSAIAFSSWAQNLVSDDTNTCYIRIGSPPPCEDVFVHDRDTVPTFVPFMSR